MFTTRIRIASRPLITAGTIGVFVFGWTFASRSPAGRLLSRAIANDHPDRRGVHGEAADGHRDHHADQEDLPDRVAEHVEDDELEAAELADLGALMLATDIIANSRISPPRMNEAITARMIASGAVLRGSWVSSPSELAVSKPYIT